MILMRKVVLSNLKNKRPYFGEGDVMASRNFQLENKH